MLKVLRPIDDRRFENEFVDPAAYFASPPLPDEARLMIAILEDAFAILSSEDREKANDRAEAMRWFENNDRAWPFSFLSITDVLGYPALELRRRARKKVMAGACSV